MPNYSNRGLSPSTHTNCKPGEYNQFYLKYDASISDAYSHQNQIINDSKSLRHVQLPALKSGQKEETK